MPRRNRKWRTDYSKRPHTRTDWRFPSKAMIRRLERWEKYLQRKYVEPEGETSLRRRPQRRRRK